MVITDITQIKNGHAYYQTIFSLNQDKELVCTVFSLINVLDCFIRNGDTLFRCKESVLGGIADYKPTPISIVWFCNDKDSTLDRTFTTRKEAESWITYITSQPLNSHEEEIYNRLVWIYDLHLELDYDEHEWDM